MRREVVWLDNSRRPGRPVRRRYRVYVRGRRVLSIPLSPVRWSR